MRTTLTLDDKLAEALKEHAAESGQSFKQTVHETLARGLAAPASPRRFRQRTFSLGGVPPGLDLTHALRLAAERENLDLSRKLALRK